MFKFKNPFRYIAPLSDRDIALEHIRKAKVYIRGLCTTHYLINQGYSASPLEPGSDPVSVAHPPTRDALSAKRDLENFQIAHSLTNDNLPDELHGHIIKTSGVGIPWYYRIENDPVCRLLGEDYMRFHAGNVTGLFISTSSTLRLMAVLGPSVELAKVGRLMRLNYFYVQLKQEEHRLTEGLAIEILGLHRIGPDHYFYESPMPDY